MLLCGRPWSALADVPRRLHGGSLALLGSEAAVEGEWVLLSGECKPDRSRWWKACGGSGTATSQVEKGGPGWAHIGRCVPSCWPVRGGRRTTGSLLLAERRVSRGLCCLPVLWWWLTVMLLLLMMAWSRSSCGVVVVVAAAAELRLLAVLPWAPL